MTMLLDLDIYVTVIYKTML